MKKYRMMFQGGHSITIDLGDAVVAQIRDALANFPLKGKAFVEICDGSEFWLVLRLDQLVCFSAVRE